MEKYHSASPAVQGSAGVINGATILVPIVGDPIMHVRSPTLLTDTFCRRGINIVVAPLHVKTENFGEVVGVLQAVKNIRGFIATAPYKMKAFQLCETLTLQAKLARSASLVRKNSDNSWHGDLTDGIAFVRSIEIGGYNPVGGHALVIGAGGVGRAIAFALLASGITRLAAYDTDQPKLSDMVASLDTIYPGQVFAGSPDPTGFDLLVNATPLGMRAEDPLPMNVSRLAPSMFVADVVTSPEVTPLLAEAKLAGCRIQTGTGLIKCALALMADFFSF